MNGRWLALQPVRWSPTDNTSRRDPRLRATRWALTALIAGCASLLSLNPLYAGPPACKPGSPGNARYYDRLGSYNGRAFSDSRGNTTYYDRSGAYDGRASSSGHGQVNFYDRSGRYAGRASTTGSTTTYYDRGGAYRGRSSMFYGQTQYYGRGGEYLGRASSGFGQGASYYDRSGRPAGRTSTDGCTTPRWPWGPASD